jgi:hypothetical protein
MSDLVHQFDLTFIGSSSIQTLGGFHDPFCLLFELVRSYRLSTWYVYLLDLLLESLHWVSTVTVTIAAIQSFHRVYACSAHIGIIRIGLIVDSGQF